MLYRGAMARRAIALALLVCAGADAAPWCSTGMSQPDFAEDSDQPSIDVILVQAPLFSSDPKIGQKLRWFGMFHTALVLSQQLPGVPPQNWTLELAAVTNVIASTLPRIVDEDLIWDNDARYCVTPGILWGREHWTQSYEVVTRLTARQGRKVFADFVLPLNASGHKRRPLYQLWRVASRSDPKTDFIKDLTCGDGVSWFLKHAQLLGAPLPSDFTFKSTKVDILADRIKPVNRSSPDEWSQVVDYFRGMQQEVQPNQTFVERLETLWGRYRSGI